jgi:N-acetyltransferase 10
LGGSFRDIEIRVAIASLENMGNHSGVKASQDAMVARRKSSSDKISADELELSLTPHDMKRLELYGRNLCDHHLVTDLLPAVGRLYFTGRLGPVQTFECRQPRAELTLESVSYSLRGELGSELVLLYQ